MNPTIEINTPEIVRIFERYRAMSKRGLAEDINQLSYSIVNSAFALTKQADKQAIKTVFAPTGKKVVGYRLRYARKKLTKKEALGAS